AGLALRSQGVFWPSKFSTTLIDRRLDSSTRLAHHLDAHRRVGAGGKVVGPEGGTPAPTLSRRFRGSGSQRVPLSTVMNANGEADAGHKRRLENRLMVRRRDPYGSRPAGPESSKNFRVSVKVKINMPRALWRTTGISGS